MPRTYSQTINAAQVYSLSPNETIVNGNLTMVARYTVGFLAGDGTYTVLQGANAVSASLTIPVTTSIASFSNQLKALVASQEALDLPGGDRVMYNL